MMLQALPAVALSLPLLVAALLAAGAKVFGGHRRTHLVAIATAAGVTACCLVLTVVTATGPVVLWFGGWTPLHSPSPCHAVGCAIGVDFTVDPVGAAMASLAGVLVLAALVFSWEYFTQVGSLFNVLLLVFLGGMVGFCFTGDLFDMFVFFEVMGAAAYGLTAYRVEDRGPIQGALNFAITNSVGAYLTLAGIGLLYARTGALNMLQIGQSLQGTLDGLVVAAWLMVCIGFLVKAAVVPFHFWLADAHAAAPTPACLLFSGVMAELGLYAVARLQWTVFAPVFGAHSGAVRGALLGFGVMTALVGAVMCVSQHHLKRLLAFSTISHVGMFLCGIAVFTPLGLAAAGVYILGHGVTKAALFVGAGILVHRFHLIDETDLLGMGRRARMYGTGLLFVVGGFALAGLPPFGTYMGKGLLEDAAMAQGMPWLVAVVVVASALTGGAVIRFAGRTFFGIDDAPAQDQASRSEGVEIETGTGNTTPPTMFVPMAVLLALACVIGLLPALFEQAQAATARFMDTAEWAHLVLGQGATLAAAGRLEPTSPTLFDAGTGAAAAAGAVLVAVAAWTSKRGPRVWQRSVKSAVWAVRPLRRLHSGDVRDYVAFLVLGAGVLGALIGAAAIQ